MVIRPYIGLTLSENQLKVLKCLNESYNSDYNCHRFSYTASETGLDVRTVRLATRALARKGFAEYMRGLFDDDGQVAGSGYCCTDKGHEVIERMEELARVREEAKTL